MFTSPIADSRRRSIVTPCLVVAVAVLLVAAVASPTNAVAGTGVSGVVVDATTSQPLSGALVSWQATDERTTTAGDGSFSLPGAIGANLVIVAAKKGYYNNSIEVTSPATGEQIALKPVPQGNNPNYPFPNPLNCGLCHVEQVSQWMDSPMAKAGTNTWVYDVYDGSGSPGGGGGFVYKQHSVHAGSNPNSECASCHQPEPWIKAPYSALDPIGNPSPEALHGVSCEVCHKIAHIDESKPNFPGIWPGVVTFTRPDLPLVDNQVQYGVLGDSSYELPTVMQPSYQPQMTAAMCAACHQDKNDPDGDLDFEESDGVISEPTYLEWLNSPYADPAAPEFATCVDCHMPAFGATEVCSAFGYPAPIRDPDTIRSHRIEGTTPAFLENAVSLSVDAEQLGGQIVADVSIVNDQTGHSVPTGVTIRNMILLVEAWRESDGQMLAHTGTQTVHTLGGVGDPAQGYYAGLPGKLYAKHNHDASGAGPTFFTDATGILWDNRIPALGQDDTRYTFDVPLGTGPVHVQARLIYRRAFRFFVDAKQWTLDGHGNPLADVQAPHFGHLMEQSDWAGPGAAPVTIYGSGCGGLAIGSQNTPKVGATDFTVTLSGAIPGAPAVLLLGSNPSDWLGMQLPLALAPFGAPGCSLLLAPISDTPLTVDPSGGITIVPNLASPAYAGVTLLAQFAAAEPSLPLGWALSDAMAIWIQP